MSYQCKVLLNELIHKLEDLGEKIESMPKGEKIIMAKIVDNKLSYEVYLKS